MHDTMSTSRFPWLARVIFLLVGAISVSSLTPPVRAGQDAITYLPVVMRDSTGVTPSPLPIGSAAQQALDRLNVYRSLAGASLL